MGDSVTCSPVVFWLVSIVHVHRKAHILCTLSVLGKNAKVKVTKYLAAKLLLDVEQNLTTQLQLLYLTVHQCTYHSSGNFVFGKFCAINFYVEKFSWPGATLKIYYHENVCTYIEKIEDYERDHCVHGFHVYHDIWEAAVAYIPMSARLYATCSPSPLPGCPSPLLPALLDSPDDSLSWYCE